MKVPLRILHMRLTVQDKYSGVDKREGEDESIPRV